MARRTFLTLDAGLIDDEMRRLGRRRCMASERVGTLADLSERNIGTRLINARSGGVWCREWAAARAIAALFFRHHSVRRL